MPASLRQELEDTISSLKSQVITRSQECPEGSDGMHILINKLISELVPEISVVSWNNLVPRMKYFVFWGGFRIFLTILRTLCLIRLS